MHALLTARLSSGLTSFSRCARWAFAALAISIGVTVAHGCHAADADHEPAVATPLADECSPP